MRTTLVLDDELVRQAKDLAVHQDVTLSEFVNQALREALHPGELPAEQPSERATPGTDRPKAPPTGH